MKNNLRKIRIDAHLSIKDLSEKTGLSYSTIYNIEHKNVIPTIKTGMTLAAALHVKVEDIFQLN